MTRGPGAACRDSEEMSWQVKGFSPRRLGDSPAPGYALRCRDGDVGTIRFLMFQRCFSDDEQRRPNLELGRWTPETPAPGRDRLPPKQNPGGSPCLLRRIC